MKDETFKERSLYSAWGGAARLFKDTSASAGAIHVNNNEPRTKMHRRKRRKLQSGAAAEGARAEELSVPRGKVVGGKRE